MNRTKTLDNHDLSLYRQASGTIYGLMDHFKHENQTLPVNPNSLSFHEKGLNKKLTESLYRDQSHKGPSQEFKHNSLIFCIFHLTYLLISIITNILLYTNSEQAYNHFLLRITFLSFICTLSFLVLCMLFKFHNLLNHSRKLFSSLAGLVILYLIICDERVLSGISGEKLEVSNPGTVLLIGIYMVMFRYVLIESFVFMALISIFALGVALIFFMAFSSVSVLSGLSDFFTLLVFLVLQVMETHQVDLRTRQLFWRKHSEEEYLNDFDFTEEEDNGLTNINTEIEILIKSCDRIKQTIKTVSAVIMYKDVRNKLKTAQSELEKVKRRMAQGGFANVVRLEQNPGISEDDKLFIFQNFTSNNIASSRKTRVKASDLFTSHSWSNVNSEIENLLKSIGNYWNLDMWFIYSSIGSSVYVIGKHLVQRWQLNELFCISEGVSDGFFMTLERSYLNNPYHNACHASDVLHNILYFFKNSAILAALAPLELLSVIIAGLGHDVGHPSFTNKFLINTKDEIALTYNDKSILENMHISKTYSILNKNECNILENLSEEDWFLSRRIIIEMILETDMSKHFESLGKFRTRSSSIGDINLEKAEDRLFVMCMAIKSADIGHSAKVGELHEKWTALVCEEFFNQGDMEKERNLPVSIYCDRETTDIPKSQAGFIKNICLPLYEAWCGYLKSDEIYKNCYEQLKTNLKAWESKIKS